MLTKHAGYQKQGEEVSCKREESALTYDRALTVSRRSIDKKNRVPEIENPVINKMVVWQSKAEEAKPLC